MKPDSYDARCSLVFLLTTFLALVVVWLCPLQASLAQQKSDQLLVYGNDFLFSVKEPKGWAGDTTNADKFEANVVFHEANQPLDSYAGLIRIRLNPKEDENTSIDMEDDMNDYKQRFPGVQFKELTVKHPNYVCIAKAFYIPGDFYEYVAYVNPGPKKQILFSASMNTGKSVASPKELAAYRTAIESLTLLKP